MTGLSILFALGAGLLFWDGQLLWGVFWVLLASVADMLDGATARAARMETLFGGILDHVSDRYGEYFILAGIALSGRVHPAWAMFALFGMLIASYTRAAAESIGRLPTCAVGIVGRLEKFALIMLGAVLEYSFPKRGFFDYALIAVGASSIITSLQRLVFAWKELRKKK